MGFVIGHEISHGFDDTDFYFDEEGNLMDLWEPESMKKFLLKVKCIIEQYGNYTYEEVGMHVSYKMIIYYNRFNEITRIFHRNFYKFSMKFQIFYRISSKSQLKFHIILIGFPQFSTALPQNLHENSAVFPKTFHKFFIVISKRFHRNSINFQFEFHRLSIDFWNSGRKSVKL